MENLMIEGVRAIDPALGTDSIRDALVVDGRFADPASCPVPDGARRIDGRGLLLAPGFMDVHVHFRDPGATDSETLHTGALGAAHGGFTHVVTMPNTIPACDSAELIGRQIDAVLPVRILPSACLTIGREGRAPTDCETLAAAGAAAFTDDGCTVADDAVMAEAMRRAARAGKPVMDHAVNPAICGGGIIRDCAAARCHGLPVMPPEAEVEAVRRDIALCRKTGCRLHIQHVSCAGSIGLIAAARREGLPVTGEATPHHLAFSAEDIPGDDPNWRMNPPLGSPDDVKALRAAVLDGTIQIFATDHAPHSARRKSGGFRGGASGVLGMECAIGVTYRVMVRECGMPVADWIRAWTAAPAALLGRSSPTLAPGATADFTLIDPDDEWIVDSSRFASLSRNCPFDGSPAIARPVMTCCEGRVTFDATQRSNT